MRVLLAGWAIAAGAVCLAGLAVRRGRGRAWVPVEGWIIADRRSMPC